MKVSSVLLFMLFFQLSFAQKNFTALDKALEEKKNLLGKDFVVLITKNDSVIYQKEWGDMKIKTVAPIASCSKWLTAALVMQFVDEGKISLDDKVVKYLPVFEKYGKNYITIRHCLSHQTGIQAEGGKLARLVERKKFNTLEEEVAAFAAKEIQTNPGTEFNYNEMGLNIAARVLEVVAKKRFDLLIRQKLLSPLGMRQTTFSTLDGSAHNPSGGARSTAADYNNFLKMLLHNGLFNGQRILSEASVTALRTVQTGGIVMRSVPRAAAGYQYALGNWVIEKGTDDVARAVACPGLFGTWPLIDYCRGYTLIFFVKSLLGEEKADAYRDLKKLVDGYFTSACK